MEIKDVIEYVVHTPNNPNPAVLRSLLEDLVEPGPGPEPPAPSEDRVLLPEREVRTYAYDDPWGLFSAPVPSPKAFFDNDEIIVYFDGKKYICNKNGTTHPKYGEPIVIAETGSDIVFAEYPFMLAENPSGNLELFTGVGGAHTIKILAGDEGAYGNNYTITYVKFQSTGNATVHGSFIVDGKCVGEINVTRNDSTPWKLITYGGSATIQTTAETSVISGNAEVVTSGTVIIGANGRATIGLTAK